MKSPKLIALQKSLSLLFFVGLFWLVIYFQKNFDTSTYDYKITNRFQSPNLIFKNINQDEKEIEQLLRENIQLIVSRSSFLSSLAVVEKHEETIRREAKVKNFPEDIALGVALLENGGSDTEISSAGAAGVFQLIESTAKTLGLKVEEGNDERLNPEKNISAGISYLKKNLDLFGDLGLAIWAHHAGPQNVSKALKMYMETTGKEPALTYREAIEQKNYQQ